jgi:hypothetical protein
MIRDLGVGWVIVGHSEVRGIDGEMGKRGIWGENEGEDYFLHSFY